MPYSHSIVDLTGDSIIPIAGFPEWKSAYSSESFDLWLHSTEQESIELLVKQRALAKEGEKSVVAFTDPGRNVVLVVTLLHS